jgi:integrase
MAGTIYEASGAFYVRYVTGMTVSESGKPRPVQKSHRLCERNDKYYSSKAKAVKLLRDEFMLTVSTRQGRAVAEDMRIVDFWEQRYLPYCNETLQLTGRPRKKPSTIRGYKQIWTQHLKSHFGNITLQGYEPRLGTMFLQSLTGTQGKATLKHIKALGSSLFKRAVIEQRIKVNPWHDVAMPDDAIESSRTPHYTWEEAENIISALVDRVDCQLIMALACFLGLRPNEIAPLRWEDFDGEWLHIRRGYVRGKLDVPKTRESIRSVPLVDRVRVPLELWRQKSKNPTEGWLFPSEGTLPESRIVAPELKHLAGCFSPLDLHNVISRVIVPALKEKKLTWKPLKAGRTGACTEVIERSNGNAALAQALLGHKDMATTTSIYKKQVSLPALQNGMRLLD